MDDFVEWCSMYHLLPNVNKTKEMVVDFKRTGIMTKPINIMGKEVGLVEYLLDSSVHYSSRLISGTNTNSVYKMRVRSLFVEEAKILQFMQQDTRALLHLLYISVQTFSLIICSNFPYGSLPLH